MADKKPPGFSESDKAKLDDLLSDAAFERRIKERNKHRREEVRAWVTWVASILLLVNLLKDWLKSAWASILTSIGP